MKKKSQNENKIQNVLRSTSGLRRQLLHLHLITKMYLRRRKNVLKIFPKIISQERKILEF